MSFRRICHLYYKSLNGRFKNNYFFPRQSIHQAIRLSSVTDGYRTPSDSTRKTQGLVSKIFENNDDYINNLISHLETDMRDKNRIYKNDFLNLLRYIDDKKSVSGRDAIVLIKCCSDMLIDESPKRRIQYLDEIWSSVKDNSEIDINHYNELLKSYTANHRKVTTNSFIDEMLPHKPTEETYVLLLLNASKIGDIDQISDIITNMKNANVTFNERIYGIIIEGYAHSGNIKMALDTVASIKSPTILQSPEVGTSMIKAYVIVRDEENTKKQISSVIEKKIKLSETQATEIIQSLADNDMKNILPECLSLFPNETLSAPSMSTFLQTFCTKLVNEGHQDIAYFIYSHLSAMDIGSLHNTSTYGRILLRECIKVSNTIDDVSTIINGLIKSERNPEALYTAYEACLHFKKWNIAVDLLKRMKDENKEIRCHFFWPLFVGYAEKNGENGVFEVVQLMKTFGLTVDHDTLSDYIIPHMSLAFPKDAIKKFQRYDMSLSECLTPVVLSLINQGNSQAASELCETVNGKLDCDLLVFPLLLNYLSKNDVNSTHNILRSFQEKAKFTKRDWVGKFLISFLAYRKWDVDVKYFENLIRVLSDSDTKISQNAVERCCEYLNGYKDQLLVERLKKILHQMIDPNITDSSNLRFSQSSQESMMTKELETHLIELESGNMNSRGVLRKLLQQYVQQNNIEKAKIILQKCEAKRVLFSPGMKSSIMHMYIKCGDLKMAEKYLNDILKSDPKFVLDEFKILDYAALLVKNNQLSKAIDILNKRASGVKIRGGNLVETNCWNLLNAVASTYDPEKTNEMFALLTKLKYCSFSNILLGPLVRAYLNKSDISGAVSEFVNFSNRYKKTPLKHELLCILVNGSSDPENSNSDRPLKKSDYQSMLIEVLNCDRRLHGLSNSQVSLIAAFAETGLTKSLRSFLMDPTLEVNRDEMISQCDRFADENKVQPLMNLAHSIEGLKRFNSNEIYEIIMDVHERNGNCEDALKLWTTMRQDNIRPTLKTCRVLASMLRSNKRDVPDDLSILLKNTNAESNNLL